MVIKSMSVQETVKSEWSTIDVRSFGPYYESMAAVLADKIWSDAAFKAELLSDPAAVLAREVNLILPTGRKINLIDKHPNEFYFVLPEIPPQEELWYRYEQISGWWMFAHSLWWWMNRQFGPKVLPFLTALNVQIIGRTWNDLAWRQAMIDHPRETLELELGAKFPPELQVRSLVDTPEAIHLVIPTQPQDENIEAASEYLAGMFAIGHTWWQWLVYPKLLRSIDPTIVTGMVD
jgi:hypothetical protein